MMPSVVEAHVPSRHAAGLDPFGATFPDSDSLLARIDTLRADRPVGGTVAVVIGTISNGEDIAEVHGAHALSETARQVVDRLTGTDPRVVALRISALGGFAVVVLLQRGDPEELMGPVLARREGFVHLDGARVWPVVTVGVRGLEGDDDSWTALRDARSALFEAGQSQRGTVRWHRRSSARTVEDGGDLRLVGDLAQTLLEQPEQIRLAYQPVYDLRSRTLISSEALMRWTHPVRGAVNPLTAVVAAERSGLIHRLGTLVLDRALEQTSAWRGHLSRSYRTHVNVSALELQETGYVERVADALRRSGVPAPMLLLEITETAMLSEDPGVLQTLHGLRDLGVGLGIDDFGTGYSSISQLHRLPIDTVKIDRSLIQDIAISASDFALIRRVLGLLDTTRVTVIAEGIETAVQASHLRAVGAMFGQGYLLGRPMAPEAFVPAVGPLAG